MIEDQTNDIDGEVEDQAPLPHPQTSRRGFLSKSLLASAVVVPSLTLLTSSKSFAGGQIGREMKPTVEKAQSSAFRSIQQHENDHVAFLLNALGGAARPRPTFTGLKQKKYNDFSKLARVFENTGVGAYLGAAGFINDPVILSAAASIATVEARHAGFLNRFLNGPITQENESFESPLTADAVVAGVSPFIVDLNGGPPVTYQQVRSPDNDIAILNFALALEFLEQDFYNINVPRFYD